MIRESNSVRIAAGLALAALLIGVSGAPARAGKACSGVYSTSVIRDAALPLKVTFAQNNDNADQELVYRFVDGLRGAGGLVDLESPLRLTVVFTTTTPELGPQHGKVYNNFNWLYEKGAQVDATASVVNVTAQVMDMDRYSYVWIASAQCTVKVPDAGEVAADIGELIGRTLGRGVLDGKF
jgi:hypothetical protein